MENIWPVYHRIEGNIVILGFGGIGRGILPLILRHFDCKAEQIIVIDQNEAHKALAIQYGVNFITQKITPQNYRDILLPLLGADGFLVNVSFSISSKSLIAMCQEHELLYIDTFTDIWGDANTPPSTDLATTGNHAIREDMLSYVKDTQNKSTAITCCGANPGMVSWLVKQALVNISKDLGTFVQMPQNRIEWAQLMQSTGVKGIHISERDGQRAKTPRQDGTFVNTWSVAGLIEEGLYQPAEFGWGTHEKQTPETWRSYGYGTPVSVYLEKPGATTKVRSWVPSIGEQQGYLIAHNETLSIPAYFTLKEAGVVQYAPTCHYAYRPCEDAIHSLKELIKKGWQTPQEHVLLDVDDIEGGFNELGVLLYGHDKNAYWYGSHLSIEETRRVAPHQNATALQVTSALLAGMVWAIENPKAGVVEAEEMDHARCLEVQEQYLGEIIGVYSDWTPLCNQKAEFANDDDPWQFVNVLINAQ